MACTISSSSFSKTNKFLNNLTSKKTYYSVLKKYASAGVTELQHATPIDTGLTAYSWDYDIVSTSTGYDIYWTNSNIQGRWNIAVLIQYGHGTNNGGYFSGIDYINPAIDKTATALINAIMDEVHDS